MDPSNLEVVLGIAGMGWRRGRRRDSHGQSRKKREEGIEGGGEGKTMVFRDWRPLFFKTVAPHAAFTLWKLPVPMRDLHGAVTKARHPLCFL